MTGLTQKHCVPCKGGMPPFTEDEARKLLAEAPGWVILKQVQDDKPHFEDGKKILSIRRKFSFKNFREVMAFLNRVAEIAEAEGHHPDIEAHYREVTLTFFTHAIGGLSENDFIMATKANGLL